MGSLKDSLKEGKEVHTLTKSELEFLQNIHAWAQAEVDQMQQRLAATFLHHVAVERFGYKPEQELMFNILPQNDTDNLEVTVQPS